MKKYYFETVSRFSQRYHINSPTRVKFGAVCGIMAVILFSITVPAQSGTAHYSGITDISNLLYSLSDFQIYASSYHTQHHWLRLQIIVILSVLFEWWHGAMLGAIIALIAKRLESLIGLKLSGKITLMIICTVQAATIALSVHLLIGVLAKPALISVAVIGYLSYYIMRVMDISEFSVAIFAWTTGITALIYSTSIFLRLARQLIKRGCYVAQRS